MKRVALSFVLTALFFASVLSVVWAQSETDWWPMFRHDSTHAGYSTSTMPNTNHTLWSYTTGGDVPFSPIVADGKVYVSSEDNSFYCLDASNGDLKWKYAIGSAIGGHGAFSSAAVADGKVYVGSLDNNTYCLDASTGALIWKYTTGDELWSSPAVADGKVYIGSADRNVYCLNASTGDLIWNYTLSSWISNSSPAVVSGKVYIGSTDGTVYCLDASTGALIWKYTTGAYVGSSPAVADGKVYVGSLDNNTYCLDASTGNFIWKYTARTIVGSSPAVADGKVYVYATYVCCLNASDGDLIWADRIGDLGSSPAVADGKVFIGSEYDVVAFGAGETPAATPTATTAWVPLPENAAAATAVTAIAVGAVSVVAAAVGNPVGASAGKAVEKTSDLLSESVKKWLSDFISSRRKSTVDQKTGSPFLPTKREILAYAASLVVLTFSFSYVKVNGFTQILSVLPTVLATAVIVEFVKTFALEVAARRLGVWSEHRIWYFGLAMFLVTTFAFGIPFSSPTRTEYDTSKSTKRLEGIVSSAAILVTLAFAAFFFALMISGFTLIGSTGLAMCIIMAFLDAFPVAPMNGRGIYAHSKAAWAALFVATLAVYLSWLLLL